MLTKSLQVDFSICQFYLLVFKEVYPSHLICIAWHSRTKGNLVRINIYENLLVISIYTYNNNFPWNASKETQDVSSFEIPYTKENAGVIKLMNYQG